MPRPVMGWDYGLDALESNVAPAWSVSGDFFDARSVWRCKKRQGPALPEPL
jgi:hypothetical protein